MHLSHLIFADNIVLIAQSPQELQEWLSEIHNFSRPVGLIVHLGNNKMMLNNHINQPAVTIDGTIAEGVDKYVYLGKVVTRHPRVYAGDQEMHCTGTGCLRQGRQHEKPQDRHEDQEESLKEWCPMAERHGKWPMDALVVAQRQNGADSTGHCILWPEA